MSADSQKDASGWSAARTLAAKIGEAPAPFANCVRRTFSSATPPNDPFLKRLVTGAFREAFSQLVAKLYPEAAGKPAEENLKLFSGAEVASFLTAGFMLRRVEATMPQAFAHFYKDAATHIEIGVLLGRAMGSVGLADGLLVPAARWTGLIGLAGEEPGKLETYRAKISKSGNYWYNIELEDSTWGVNHAQLGSLLMSKTGIPSERATVLNTALSLPLDASGDKAADRVRIIAIMVEALAQDKDIPELPGDEAFMMDESKMDTLLANVQHIRSSGSSVVWKSELGSGAAQV